MHMIRHEHIGMDCTAMRHGCLLQRFEVNRVIFTAEENRLAVVAALNNMQRLPRHHDPWHAGHLATPLRVI